jgi:hypothetical protein
VSSRTSSPVVSSLPPPPKLPLAPNSPDGRLLPPAAGPVSSCVSSYRSNGPVSSAADGAAAAWPASPPLLPLPVSDGSAPEAGSAAPSPKLRYSVSSRMQMGCVNADGRIEDLQAA